MVRGKEEIKTMDDVIKCMNHIMEDFDGAWEINHQYHQVLQIHRETTDLKDRMNRLENKLDKIITILSEVNTNGK